MFARFSNAQTLLPLELSTIHSMLQCVVAINPFLGSPDYPLQNNISQKAAVLLSGIPGRRDRADKTVKVVSFDTLFESSVRCTDEFAEASAESSSSAV